MCGTPCDVTEIGPDGSGTPVSEGDCECTPSPYPVGAPTAEQTVQCIADSGQWNEGEPMVECWLECADAIGEAWEGIICLDGEPSLIDMGNNDMAGTIPTEFGLLTKAVSITLEKNSFNGVIPTQIGYLTVLSEWYMAQNQLTGQLPTEIGNVDAMSGDFDLRSNALGGTVPSELGLLVKLEEELLLDHNQIGGSLPTELSRLNVVEIQLQSNRLCGVIPAVVSSMDNFADNPERLRPGNLMGPTPCPATSALAALYRSTHDGGNSWSGSQLNWMEGDPCEAAKIGRAHV